MLSNSFLMAMYAVVNTVTTHSTNFTCKQCFWSEPNIHEGPESGENIPRVCVPLIPENNVLISPNPWKKIPQRTESISPSIWSPNP